MNLKSNKLYLDRCKEYFKDDYEQFVSSLSNDATKSFFLNKLKGNNVLNLIDFEYKQSILNEDAYYYDIEHISNSKVYELGLIYPQGIESSLSSKIFDRKDIRYIVDLCSAPGGKSINFVNKYKDSLLVSNDINYKRQLLTANNFERLGIDNAIICSMDTKTLSNKLKSFADLVILDAPCSGEGMARKNEDIFDAYSDKEIEKLSKLQEELLDDAYNIMNNDSYLIYSTCTFSFEEDENQVIKFLEKHEDVELINNDIENNHSTLTGTIKLNFANNTEGQFISIFHKKGLKTPTSYKTLKVVKNKIVESFIKDNLYIDDYYLYQIDDKFYISFKELLDLKNGVIREGIYLGNIEKNRFVPNHFMYRANSLIGLYKFEYDLSEKDYNDFVKGLEIKTNNLSNNYYHLTYKGYSVGFGKVNNNVIKNKYPKGLRK